MMKIKASRFSIVNLDGSFDFFSRKQFTEIMKLAWSWDAPNVLVNFEKVSSIDSAALDLLVMTYHDLKSQYCDFGILNPITPVLKTLELAKVHKIVPVYASMHDAMAAMEVR